VHGEEGLRAAQEQTQALFEGAGAAEETVVTAEDAASWPALFLAAGLVSSLSEARRLIKGGGLYAGDERLTEDSPPPAPDGVLMLRKGKRERRAVRVG
jgi:tyrosyl-tRNA synthetase